MHAVIRIVLCRLILIAEGVYLLLGGLWPFVNGPGFFRVTGWKHDIWLVHMVSLFMIAVAIVLLMAISLKEVSRSILMLALLSAVSLLWIDVHYVLTGTLRSVYLVDACIQGLFVAALLYAFPVHRSF